MNQHDIFFSLVIPTYNRASFLQQNLPDLLNLDYAYYEIIVVDDGSTDNTSDVVNAFVGERVKYFYKQNGERAAARNYGALRALGDYITFLDSDDIMFIDALKHAQNAIVEKQFPYFLHLAYEIGTNQSCNKTIDNIKDNDPLVLVKGNPLSCMGIFIRKSVFTTHLFNEDRLLSASEDWEYWMRLAANFGLRTDNRKFGRLIEHDSRSVVSSNKEKLIQRRNLAVQYAFQDEAVQKVFGRYRSTIEAHWDTYISLHLAMDGLKVEAFKYLLKGAKNDFRCLLTMRCLVIFKFLLKF